MSSIQDVKEILVNLIRSRQYKKAAKAQAAAGVLGLQIGEINDSNYDVVIDCLQKRVDEYVELNRCQRDTGVSLAYVNKDNVPVVVGTVDHKDTDLVFVY